MAKKSLGQTCPIARSLDIVGERWTLLIIRDLLPGSKRFQDFQESLVGIAPNVLSDRLKTLEKHGLVKRQFYSDHPPRADYALTDKGAELGVAVLALGRWGMRHLGPNLHKGFLHDECYKHIKLATDSLMRQPVRRQKRAEVRR
jgi:DNA-binding HxlR family transcriptional regulator